MMSDLYEIGEAIYKGDTETLYRGVCRNDGKPVIIKTLLAEISSSRQIDRLIHEYDIGQRFEGPYQLKPSDLDPQRGRLILEEFDGEPLSGQTDSPLEIGRFLDIAVPLTAALADTHRQDIVHKDIKPVNILINPRTGAVKLTGFGIATRLVHSPTALTGEGLMEGSLAYMSPEQTGRMNRGIDHRSDLYSLGVIYYQMLTGELPFHAADPLEWTHCHIARSPRPPGEIVPAIPDILAAIVLKLMAKEAEERYQSAGGLQWDLERCREQWVESGKIDSFPLGKEDASDRFLISPKFYGREKEVAALLDNFAEVAATGKARFTLVSGYSGIGKSSLVRELNRPVVRVRGYFIAGKFDQYQRDIPYATMAKAFSGLLQQILTECDTRIQSWKAALEKALGANGRLLVDLIPQLELIIGPQPPVPELSPTEAQHRFHLVFHRFVGVFARKEHPLVLFLDDLQWLDPASLKLMTYLMTHPEPGALFLIGAYRDNEVNPSHPLMHALDEACQSGVSLQEVVLGPLSPGHLQQWVADTLRQPLPAAEPLALLIYKKTAGNPFFTIQFMTALYQEGLLTYDRQQQCWRWDLQAIQKHDFTDNVVELMLGKLKRFSAPTRKALMLAACLGNTAEVASLALLYGQPEEELHTALREAVDEGLIWPVKGRYRFLHDRVQEAAYILLPENERPAQHLRIGRLLLSHTPEEKPGESIFEIVGHLNRGADLITSRDERERLAELNLMAGKRAKATTAYASALTYFITGSGLLDEDIWERRHELVFSLEINKAECEFLIGDRESTERRLTVILENTTDTVEQAAVACLRIDLYTTLDQSNRAIATGLDFLQDLGINCQPHPSAEEVRCEYDRIRETLGACTLEELLNRPLMSDPAILAIVEVLTKIWPPALFSDAGLASLIICKAVGISFEWGNCDASCFAYTLLGRIAGPSFGDYKDGFRFGELGYELIERRGLKRFKARTYLCFSNSIVPWMKHVDACHDLQLRALEAAKRSGDLLYEAFACNSLNTNLLFAGKPLSQAQGEVEQRLAFVEKARFGLVIDSIAAQLALIRTLRGLTPKFGSFDDGQFNELRTEHRFSNNPLLAIAACRYWIRKLQTCYIAGDYARAIEAESKARQLLWTAPLAFEEAEYHFYGALVQAVCCDHSQDDQRKQHFKALTSHHRQFEIWAENCPANFENRFALVSAEIARIEERDLEAMRSYEQAIQSARENGFVQNEALAYELAAQFYRLRGYETIADAYLCRARACYQRWGADGKVRQLDRLYPRLAETLPLIPSATFAAGPEQLDLLAVIKALQAISREILLKNLQETLMRLALEQSGAQLGFLLLIEGESLSIRARAEIAGEGTRVEVTPAQPVSDAKLPLSLLNFIRRTGKAVVLADAAAEGSYVDDNYITRHRSRSVLGLPILRQSRVAGLLYLENNLTAGAFTADRLAALELLAAQAAVSLETARLYAELQQENAERLRVEEEILMLNQELEQRVLERTSQLEAVNKELEAFAYSVSHDLRTPLGHIDGFLELLQERVAGTIDVQSRQYMDDIAEATTRMQQLIDDLLSFSRMGRQELATQSVNLANLVREVIQNQEPDTRHRHIHWQIANLPVVSGDQAMLRMAFVNLVANALKFTQGRDPAEIEIGSMTDPGGETIVYLRDNGVGFDPKYADKLFGVFQRLHRTEDFEGTGIGLANVRRIITRHGGRTWAEGEVDRGAVFYFSLPKPDQSGASPMTGGEIPA